MFDNTRFTVNPQLDSEGFTDYAAKCYGCKPEDMCPRSGSCERYDSPLRYGNEPVVLTHLHPPCERLSGPVDWTAIEARVIAQRKGPRPYHVSERERRIVMNDAITRAGGKLDRLLPPEWQNAPLLDQPQRFKEHDDVITHFRDRYEAKLLGRERDGVVVEFTCKVNGHKMKRWLSPQQEDRYRSMWEGPVCSVVDLRDLPLIDPIRGGELT